jgi:hypothetical protein
MPVCLHPGLFGDRGSVSCFADTVNTYASGTAVFLEYRISGNLLSYRPIENIHGNCVMLTVIFLSPKPGSTMASYP